MSSNQLLETLVTGKDGRCHCPKCPESFDDMELWTDHVSEAHDPFREFVARWTNLESE